MREVSSRVLFESNSLIDRRMGPCKFSALSLLFLRADSFFPPYSFYFLYRYIYMYIYVLFFWPLRLRKSSTRDVLNRFSVNVVRFDGPLVIYDLRVMWTGAPSSQRSVWDFSRWGLETESRRGIGGFVELSGNTREILIKRVHVMYRHRSMRKI